ncbi:BLOC-1-related complex subunit 8 homolog isoform X1 [Macrobrachium rosenbergii]|uniref:BLOC-1-related complex subunit 8 homolog isoform X1 n=1 Tax=Macrobrachium rosenbergii TaxID=79674 RepID=UPI0034D74EFF
MATISPPHPPNDPDLEVKVKKALERVSENIHISANEPSLAVYRLQEHVRRALPPTVTRRQHVTSLHSQLQGACYDVEYALGAVRGMQDSNEKFLSLVELLKNSIFLRQQLKFEQTRRKQREPSMYKRLSSHITSIDLPDLPDLPDAFRETASRVESALQHARNSYESHTRKGDKKDSTEKLGSKEEETSDEEKDKASSE